MIKKLLTKTKSALRKMHYKRKANFYLTLTVLLLLVLVYYAVSGYFELSEKKEIIAQSEHLIKSLNTDLDETGSEYESLRNTHNTLRETVRNEIVVVLPESEQYTELTRKLDEYFKSRNTTKNPLVATNLQYNTPKASEDESYYVLPITMTISSSEENFWNFLDYIDKSGSLSGQTRLMDIESVNINFRTPTGAKKSAGGEELNFNVQLNAYYQKLD